MKKRTHQIPNRRSGFTLLELLIVLGIILAIAAMVVPNLIGGQDEANIKTTKINIKGLENALKFYYTDHKSTYPETIDVLTVGEVTADGQTRQPYLEAYPMDAWGNRLLYERQNTKAPPGLDYKPAIWSMGPDRKNDDGAGDDINNWTVVAPVN